MMERYVHNRFKHRISNRIFIMNILNSFSRNVFHVKFNANKKFEYFPHFQINEITYFLIYYFTRSKYILFYPGAVLLRPIKGV